MSERVTTAEGFSFEVPDEGELFTMGDANSLYIRRDNKIYRYSGGGLDANVLTGVTHYGTQNAPAVEGYLGSPIDDPNYQNFYLQGNDDIGPELWSVYGYNRISPE